MCGICGIVLKDAQESVDKRLLDRAADAMSHRGPDGRGIRVMGNVGLGHRRLAIIDLEDGSQPMSNEDDSVWVVFNGEIYNHDELRPGLQDQGHAFRTRCDTETIVHNWESRGVECVEDFNGMFGFAVWDSNRGELFLARDRVGIKPLYYYEDDRRLAFGSEIKAVLNLVPDMDRSVDMAALHHYLVFNYVAGERTIFKAVRRLMPGHWLRFKDGRTRIERYWDIPLIEPRPRPFAEVAEELRFRLSESVKLRLMSDVPLGAFLSGGIDSSSVVGFMARHMEDRVRTFSIGFDDPSYNELDWAGVAAEAFQTRHTTEVVRPSAADLIETLIGLYDEPFADVSMIPTYLVSQLASREVKVCLSGDGGDELFAGYDGYVAQRLDARWSRAPAPVRFLAARVAARMAPRPQKKGLVNKFKRFVEGASLPPEGRHLRWMTFFTPDELASAVTPELARAFGEIDFYGYAKSFFARAAAADPLAQELYVDAKIWLADDILHKVDRSSMGVSLEARVPLLDHTFVEFAAGIPSRFKLDGSGSKLILKQAVRGVTPDPILDRKEKMGFSIPMKNWLRGELKPMMLDILSPARIRQREFFDPASIQRLIDQHLSGAHDHWHRLWSVMVFELWAERYL